MIDTLPSASFRQREQVQIRFNDVDMFGHLNNTVYLEFFDLGKLRYFNAVLGGDFLASKLKVVVVNINCNFLAPTFLQEPLEVLTQTVGMGEKSLTIVQQVVNADTGEVKCEATTIMASFNPATLHSEPIPDDVRRAFSAFEGKEL